MKEDVINSDIEKLKGDGRNPIQSFKDLGIHSWLDRQCTLLSYKKPTEVQVNCIPRILSGHDCIGVAKTGSGKTAAFALPILQKLSEDPFGIFSIVLTPTRELALQIQEQFRVFGAPIKVRTALVIGGTDMVEQAMQLSTLPHIVVATPGRLADYLRDSPEVISLKNLKFLVLDECDRLQDDSFKPDIHVILQALPGSHQILLFSATFSTPSWLTLKNPFKYEVFSREATVTTLQQYYIFIPVQVKACYLYYCIEKLLEKSMIIFVATCESCHKIHLMLNELNILSTPLHSKITQSQRTSSLARFRGGAVPILVATDVASRGLDIPLVDCVINFDLPLKEDDYIHRVGRTARAGGLGKSLTIVSQFDVKRFLNIEKRIKKKMEELDLNEDLVLKGLKKTTKAMRIADLKMEDSEFGAKQKRNAEKQKILEKGKSQAKKMK